LRIPYWMRISAVIIVIFLFSIGIAKTQEPASSPILEQGIGEYKHENYDEALQSLQKAREEDPTSTLAAYYLGLNYKKLQDYPESVKHLRDAVTHDPKIKGALIELIDSLFQTGKFREAKKWIAEAEKEGIRPAQVAFLKGLVLLKEEDNPGAIASFKNAKALDKAMEQSCDYQIGIAHLKEKEFENAKDVFEQVVVLDPSSNMAKYANEYINTLAKRKKAQEPWKFSFGTFWQYDDNVVLKPDDASLATSIAEEADSRQVYTAKVEYDHRIEQQLGIKGQYLFYYGKQNDLGFYDTMSHTVVAQPSVYFQDSLLSFPVSYTHTFVDERSYLSSPSVSGLYNFMAGDSSMGQASLKYSNKNFLWTPSTSDEDRDSNDLGGSFGWYFFFANRKGFLNLRYALNKEWTEGNNWEYLGSNINATVLVPVSEKLNWTVSGGTNFKRFSNTHTVFNEEREDDVHTVTTLLAYKFHEDSELQFQYTHIKDSSNIGIYEYDRNIYSTGVQLKF